LDARATPDGAHSHVEDVLLYRHGLLFPTERALASEDNSCRVSRVDGAGNVFEVRHIESPFAVDIDIITKCCILLTESLVSFGPYACYKLNAHANIEFLSFVN
jgi:hypothetical protein